MSDCLPARRVQFDFVKLLDGKALPWSLTDPVSSAKVPKGLLLSGLQETGFIEYMDPFTWHLALYNDGRNLEQVLLHSTPIGEKDRSRQPGCLYVPRSSLNMCSFILLPNTRPIPHGTLPFHKTQIFQWYISELKGIKDFGYFV